MTTINIKGVITSDENAWVYDFLGMECTTSGQVVAQLEAANDSVVVEINSPGGMVTAASEIYEAIRSYAGDIECRVIGQAASAASIIVCAAKSSISPMGFLFLHNCLSSASGNHRDMREAAQMLESIDENIMNAYREKTGLTDAEIYRLMERNTTLSAARAVELGFIDRITEGSGTVADAGAISGIAAAAPGYFDPMAISAESLAAMRSIYDSRNQATCEGGEKMDIEEIQDADEQVIADDAEPNQDADELTAVEAEADEASESDQVADADEGGEAEGDDELEDGCDSENDADDGEADEVQAAFDRGVNAERERIAGIMEIAERVPKAMVHAALFTEPISAEQLAFQAMRAEDGVRAGYMEKARADVEASKSAEVAAEVTDATEESAKDEQKRMLAEALDKKISK